MIENLISYIKDDSFLIGIYSNVIHIFNYKKIIDIRENLISLVLKDKKVEIRGSGLLIKKLDKNELLIKGNIKGIDLIDK